MQSTQLVDRAHLANSEFGGECAALVRNVDNIREVLANHGPAKFQVFVSNVTNNEPKEYAPKEGRMNVLALTIFVTLALVCFFLFFFVVTIVEGKGSARDALLPLEDDKPEPAKEGGVAK